MASFFSSKDRTDEQDQSYTRMITGDVDAIGDHCQAEYCRQLDFLPFKCQSCKKKFCLDHAKEAAHACENAGASAKARQKAIESNATLPSKPSILNHESQCSLPSCTTLINTALAPGVECAGCNRSYCLKHRHENDHKCAELEVRGARTQNNSRLMDTLNKFKSWNANKKTTSSAVSSSTKSSRTPVSASKTTSASSTSNNTLHRIILPFTSARSSQNQRQSSQIVELNKIKRIAKGDSKIPSEKRIYLHVEAVASGEGASGARIPHCDAFFSSDWSVGKMLDAAAKLLSVTNVNNQGGGEEQKLRVFHIEKGQLLRFPDKIQATDLKNCDTIVLLRGVGDPDAV